MNNPVCVRVRACLHMHVCVFESDTFLIVLNFLSVGFDQGCVCVCVCVRACVRARARTCALSEWVSVCVC
jgi:hypothetical protein